MPTLHRIGDVSIRMYADDHRPPHFHLVASDFQALVSISDLEVIAGDVRAARIAEALAWARANRDYLVRTWLELNERG